MSGAAQLKALLEIITTSAHQAIAEYEKHGHDVPTIHSKTSHPVDFETDAIALKKAVRTLQGACHQLCVSLAPPQHTIMNFGFPLEWACIRVVVRAKVADVLKKYPDGLHVDELSKLVNLNNGKLARVLRLLATKGCFTEVEPNTFANNRLSLVTASSSNMGDSLRIGAEHASKGAAVMYETMTDPEYATSDLPEKAPIMYALRKQGYNGNGSYFDFLKEDDEARDSFHRAMTGLNSLSGALSILYHYPWDEIKTFCDVGASIGTFSIPLLRMYPHLKIINQDLPEVVVQAKDKAEIVWVSQVWSKDAPELLQKNEVEFVPLNFLEGNPVPGQDMYYLRYIIHDWPDAEATTILRNVRKAMASHSRLLIHGAVLVPACRDPTTKLFGLDATAAPDPLMANFGNGTNLMYQQDLAMWLTFNAKERTVSELIALGASAALQLDKVYDLVETTVLEFKVAA